MTASTAALPLAAIVYTPADDIDALMIAAARALAARGAKPGGVVQHAPGAGASCGMELEDLASGARFPLSQDLGSGAKGCRLDPAALARATVAVRAALEGGATLLVINKFGFQETCGAGLREEMGRAAAAGIPLLTAVGERFLGDWEAFTGGAGVLLQPTLESVLGWWASLSPASVAQ